LAGVLLGARRPHVVQLVVQLVARVGKVLQQLDLAVKVNEKRLIGLRGSASSRSRLGIRRQHQVDKLARRFAFAFHRGGYAAARVNKESHTEREVALPRKALDGLGPAVLGQREVAHLQRGHQRTLLVAHGHRQHHFARLNLQGRWLAAGGLLCSRSPGAAGQGQHGKRR